MNLTGKSFCPQKSAPLHEQVRDYFESRIISGSLPSGSKLPSTQDLAREHGTHVSTVHKALTELVQKGLLVRRKRHGTFVRERGQKLRNVAIYYPEDFWKVEEFAAKRVMHAALMNLLGEKDIKGSLWIDPRPDNLQGHKFAELEKAATDGLIDAVIVPVVDPPHLAWLRKLPVPVAFSSSEDLPNNVSADMDQLARLAIQTVVEQGSRSVGLISPVYPETTDADGSPHPNAHFYLAFLRAAREAGIELHNEWIKAASSVDDGNRNQEEWGYEAMREFWRQPRHPESLVVFPDTSARGVILALLEMGVRVPQDLKLVLHKNAEIALLCPLPADIITLSLTDVARALIEQIETQFSGGQCTPKLIGFQREKKPAGINKPI